MNEKSSLNLKNFICVDYPGLVENESEAIRTLGGMTRIEQTFQRRNRKLFLNFNPDNIFSKMLCSAQIETAISSHHLQSKQTNNNHDEFGQTDSDNPQFAPKSTTSNSAPVITNDLISMPCLLLRVSKSTTKTDIIGRIDRIYTFKKIADFQYLPMSSNAISKSPNKQTNSFQFNAFYDNFKFNLIDNYEHDLRKSNIPQLFVLPPFFSRFDDPVNYSYRSEPVKRELKQLLNVTENENNDSASSSTATTPAKQSAKQDDTEELQFLNGDKTDLNTNQKEEYASTSGLIRSMRQERTSQAFLVTFNCKQIPTGPNEKLKPARSEIVTKCIQKLKELFEIRPCYLKSVLLCVTNFLPSTLKEALPYVAYYFTTGPWRSCWVRFNYDPRLNPEAKMYQMIDYRLRISAEPDQKIKAKPRSSYHKRKFRSDLSENESDYKNYKMEEDMYKFKADKLPSSRNVFYQICDIEDEDVQNLIKSDDNKPNECNEKDGWCLSNIQDKCRDIMSQKHEKVSKLMSNDSKKVKNN